MNESRLPTGRVAPARGFTLVELLIVVLIVGVMTALASPQYFKMMEKSKITEGLHLLESMKGAQARYQSKYGAYCTGTVASCSGFDLSVPTMKYFNSFTTFQAGASFPSWKASLTRNSPVALYGSYVLTYDIEPGASPKMTCSDTNCSAELLPR
jgi:prepilin-type N-terminal cleavage/methylation domain-containing protein